MLIIDLDDTIFPTKSMDPHLFDPAISVIENHYQSTHSGISADEVIAALWVKPIDVVLAHYAVPGDVVEQFYGEIARVDYKQLVIKPYFDYEIIQSYSQPKVLVTTGLEELQLAKIKALGIEPDFQQLYIDDPRKNPRRTKKIIFQQVLAAASTRPRDIWVIGDNPDSELKAGKELGMNTI